jgi:hypothetical protein
VFEVCPFEPGVLTTAAYHIAKPVPNSKDFNHFFGSGYIYSALKKNQKIPTRNSKRNSSLQETKVVTHAG